MDEWQDPIETMEEYVSSVLAGEIVACKTIIAACKRHRKDLARQGDPDFPYFFDEEHARNVCNFYPTCVASVRTLASLSFYSLGSALL
jgi:phage terminase large subunit-like protein